MHSNRFVKGFNYLPRGLLIAKFSHSNPSIIKSTLEQASQQAMRWFNVNFMKENSFFSRQVTPYDLSNNFKLVKPVYDTVQFGMHSIAYQGPLLWNVLSM